MLLTIEMSNALFWFIILFCCGGGFFLGCVWCGSTEEIEEEKDDIMTYHSHSDIEDSIHFNEPYEWRKNNLTP